MAQPSPSDVHVDSLLTGFSVAYGQSLDQYIALKVFPPVPVDHQTDKYIIWSKQDWLRDQVKIRPPATESAGSGFTPSNATYYADVFALHKDLDDQTLYNADAAFDLERTTTQFLMEQMLLHQEIQFNSDFMTTGVWGTDTTPSSLWSDTTASAPYADIDTAKRAILSTTGRMPNTLVLGYDVFVALKNHPDVRDQIKYTSANTVTADMLGAIFDIPRVFVSTAVKATNQEGRTASYDLAMGKNALLAYVAPNPGINVPSAGYVFQWRGVSDALGQTVGTTRFYIPEKRAWRIETQAAWDNKAVATDLGVFFNGAVA
jgi:hypothetical protein